MNIDPILVPLSLRHLALVACLWGLVAAGGALFRRSALFVGVALAAGGVLLSGEVGPAAAVGFFALTSWVVGRAVLRWLGAGSAGDVESLLAGCGVLGTVVGATAALPVHRAGVYAAVLLAVAVADRAGIHGGLRRWGAALRRPTSWTREEALSGLVVALALAHAWPVLLPELGPDALSTHLFVSGHLAARHRWAFDAGKYIFAVLPMLGEWIFSIGYLLGGETAARGVNLGLIFLLTRLIADAARWAGGSPRAERWAAVIFLSTPLVLLESTSLFVESVWVSLLLCGLLTLFRLLSSGGARRGEAFAVALFLGLALNAKITAALSFPFIAGLLAWRFRRGRTTAGWITAAVALAILAAAGCLPYLRAWRVTGNPVFPMFNEIFQSPYFFTWRVTDPHFRQTLVWDILWRITFETNKYLECRPGAAGFQWVALLIPAAVAAAVQRNRRLFGLFFVAGGVFVTAFSFMAYLRYVLPSVGLFAAAMGAVFFGRVQGPRRERALVAAAFSFTTFLNVGFLPTAYFYADLPLRALFSEVARRDLLLRARPLRLAVEAVNAVNLAREPVAVFGLPYIAGLTADALLFDPPWFNDPLQKRLALCRTAEDCGRLLLEGRVDFLLLSEDWGTPRRRARIEEVTDLVAAFGRASVRSLKPNIRFGRELLTNPTLESAEGWSLFPGASYVPGRRALRVTVYSPATQTVPVAGGRRYVNRVTAACVDNPRAQGRLQVNWEDGDRRFLKTDIQVFVCRPDGEEHTQVVVSPPGARYAVLYASGHMESYIDVTKVSFR